MQTENTPFVAYEPAPKLNFFIFFWVGPPIVYKLQAGGPAHSLQASSCQ